jgi:hypothetical protein
VAARGTEVNPVSEVPAASGEAPALSDYLTLEFGWGVAHNGVKFSGDPTVTFVVDNGPDFSTPPAGVSFPQVFEATDDKFKSYMSLGTRGLGHERLSTYLSAVLYADLDGTTAGSPFQSILDDHDGTKVDLSNAFIEMNGLGHQGVWSQVRARIGRQFIPDFRMGLLGSPVIDGGRFSYRGEQLQVDLFSGRWAAFYESVSVFVGGGQATFQLYPDPTLEIGVAPYMEYLYLQDTDEGSRALRHTYGARGHWKALQVDGYLMAIDTDPIELGLRANFAAGRWAVYGQLNKRLSDDDFVFDIFLTTEELRGRRRLGLGSLSPATELTLDADYQLLPWLSLGAGVWIYALDDGGDQTAFDNSFQEWRSRVSLQPPGPWSGMLQYRYRHVERGSNASVMLFDDTSRSGETAYHEINAEVSYRWRALWVRLGGYYGVYDTQSRLRNVDGSEVTGAYVRAKAPLAKHVDFKFLLGLDRGNDEFTPDINLQYTVQVGLAIYY